MTTRLSAAAGAAIRRLRRDRGWTLADLSARSGVPLSSLSKVELGQTSLGYEVLIKLCQALEIDIDHLVKPVPEGGGPPPAAGRRSVIRAEAGEPCDLGGLSGLAGATDLLRRNFTPLVLEVVEPRRTGGLLRAAGEAYLMVLEGRAVMHSDVYAPLSLSKGDGVYFDAEMGFALTAQDETPARVLLIHQGQNVSET
ncbi:MAG: XRE family transcriptional regulator [Phenylobacterium sp.]|uniref:helix-turn-helix domain-containing protein n=1 Tax=Phenylobacterium sp. TaxID=1871053 RepID=UPI002726AF9A|nr:XRE family transcriptional regulator [Phenylobacterium sp.]MDO8901330.1 XRE family transcriptional regulator [Phenylobacterium sp.]MDP2214843.1 XRE family transcriptional regulator [Phenylobacterium sp.]